MNPPSPPVGPPEEPLVSIVIPTRNRASLLREAVESALGQRHPKVEVVVVDDGSTDDTPRLLSSLARKEPRLRVLTHETGGGAPRARNAGARAARGSIITFLDDDCVFHEDKIRMQLDLLDSGHGVVYCRQIIRDLDGGWVVEGDPGAGSHSVEGLLRIGTNTILLRREDFRAVGGFDEELPRLQDFELLLRLSRRTAFAFVPEALVKGVMVGGGITLTPGPLAQAAARIMDRHEPHLTREQRSLLHYILGKFLLVDGLPGEARRYMRAALRLKPVSIRNWAGLLAAFLGPGPARWIRKLRRLRNTRFTEDPWRQTGGAPP